MRYRTIAVVFTLAALLWRSPDAPAQDLMIGLPINGIRCDTSEGVVEHIHAHLQIFDRGSAVEIPALIGIPNSGSCLYWLHTHDDSGIIHIESPIRRTFTLGEFFDIWDQPLSRTAAADVRAPRGKTLAFWVDGRRWTGDPRAIVLHDHEEIVVQNGPPFAKPGRYDWSQL